jgi:hypothetical protein
VVVPINYAAYVKDNYMRITQIEIINIAKNKNRASNTKIKSIDLVAGEKAMMIEYKDKIFLKWPSIKGFMSLVTCERESTCSKL